MLRALMLVATLLPGAVDAAPRPVTGLLAKNGPLPATIPLQIRTDAGHDYSIALTDPAIDAPVISGYLRGGEFFRLLVPPGTHRVTMAAGQPGDWQGIDTGFSDGTQAKLTLDFDIRANRRQGHQMTVAIVDGGLRVTDRRDQVICQIADWDVVQKEYAVGRRILLRYLDQSLTTRSRFCD
ncbi:hypothetical protein [Paracoccus sediminilitoris]|uniref:hypothetical protein n=1 Tax=Paracoccus sediminilitoris TaxID=2202419 RepID=UPI000DB91C7A|nr:hypothetical protein [Paracoccus sediminilitoris]